MLKIGSIFNGKYKIVDKIGSGGMGVVYLAKHITLENQWAIKEMTYDSSQMDLLAEPKILKQLNHVALPKIVDIVEANNTVYIIMDYIRGMTLSKALEEKGKFGEGEVVEIGKQLCEVLLYLHNHKPMPIIYRDMKPENIMITPDNRIVVIDFGIAREFKAESDFDTVIGYTAGYAAPEQKNKLGQSDGRTDIYSLGVTLYHLITGRSPFEPPYEFSKVRNIDNTLSEGIEYLIRKCTQNNPDDRYQNVEEVLVDLKNIYKLNSSYKKFSYIYYLKKSSFIALFAISLTLVYGGVKTMAEEKRLEYYGIIQEGIAIRENNQYEESINKFLEAKKLDPKIKESYIEISKTYLQVNQDEECIDFIENTALNENKESYKDDELTYILGTAYYNMKNYEKSSYYFKKASELNSTNIIYRRDYAVSLGKENKIEEAEALIKEIKEKQGEDDCVNYLEAEIHQVKNKFDEAINSYKKSISISKDNELKLKAYKEVIKIYSNNPKVYPNSFDSQIDIINKAKSDLSIINDFEFIELEGSAYYNKGLANKDLVDEYNKNLRKSVEVFKSLIDMGYNMPYIYSNIGNIYHYLGEFSNSEKYLSEAQKLDSNSSSIYIDLALLYIDIENNKAIENRNYSKALENYNLALKYVKNDGRDSKLVPLTNYINKLKQNGWLK